MTVKKPLTSEDLYRLVFVADPQISPDGTKIAYIKTVIDEKSKEYRSNIWMIPSAGGEPIQYTSGPKSDASPRWSPDGSKIAFVSDRGSGRQVYAMPTDGGEAYQVTKMRYGAGAPVWSPDGTMIAFTTQIDPEDSPEDYQKPPDKKAQEAREKERKEKPRVLTRLRVKSDGAMGLISNRRSHIFVVDAEGKNPARQLTSGEFDHSGPAWSPDGKYLAFACNRREDADWDPWITDLFTIPVEGGEMTKITASKGPSGRPLWTSDGKSIIYVGHRMEFGGPTLSRLWKIPSTGGEAQLLTGTFDRAIGNSCTTDSRFGWSEGGPALSPDGEMIYFLSSDHARTSIYSVPISGGDVELVLGGDREISGFTFDSSGTNFAIAVSTPISPADIGAFHLPSRSEKMLTQVNKWLSEERSVVSPEIIEFTASDGLREYGWTMKPPGFQEGKKYPAILEIHGGPHSMYGYSFLFEFQLLANQGYAVMYTNPRGSQGFGQEFVQAVNGDYGGKDFDDLMTFVDAALEQGFIDEERLGVTGGSYGGFMTNWIVGHTDRFKSAVTQRSISNWVSFHGVSDIGYNFLDRELLIDAWKDTKKAWEFSPLAYVENVNTPLLIIHSELDMRCPIEQGEQLYVALKKMKKEVEMARFPGSNHELSRGGKPVLRVGRLNQILRWFDRFIEKTPE